MTFSTYFKERFWIDQLSDAINQFDFEPSLQISKENRLQRVVFAKLPNSEMAKRQQTMRLAPHHPEWFYQTLGWAQYSVGECEVAKAKIRKMSRIPFSQVTGHGLVDLPGLIAHFVCCIRRGKEARAFFKLQG